MAYRRKVEPVMEKSGKGVFTEAGTYTRNGNSNSRYVGFSFLNKAGNMCYRVRTYVDSVYTPSWGRHKDRTCCPCTVDIFRWSNGRRGDKVDFKKCTGALIEAGTFNKKNGEPNKAYVRTSFFGANNELFVVKMYQNEVFTADKGKLNGREVCFCVVMQYNKSEVCAQKNETGKYWSAKRRSDY